METMDVDATIASMALARRLPVDGIHGLYRQCDKKDMIKVSQVCRSWRQTLHDYTGFWADIDVTLGNHDPDLKAAYWLERAGQRPLTINIGTSWEDGDLDSAEQVFLAEHSVVRLGVVLRSCMDRWETVNIMVYHRRVLDVLLPIFAGYAPKLTSLSMEVLESAPVSVDAQRPLIPLLAPIGRQIGVGLSVAIDSYIPRLTTFGRSITNLTVDCNFDTPWTSDDILQVFQSCPNLKECDLYLQGTGMIGIPSLDTPIPMLQLEELCINWVQDIENVLVVLQLPALESISLGQVDWSTEAMSALWDVFSSSQSLSAVTVTDEAPGYEDRLTAIAPFHANPLALEAVTYFDAGGNPLTRPLLERITLPRVEILHLPGVPFEVVHRLLSSSPGLCSVWLSDATGIPPDSTHSPTTLSALSHLYTRNCPGLLDDIHAPQLDSLHLLCPSGQVASSGAALRAFIERSAPNLTALYLEKIDISDEEILECLGRLPSLRTLCFSACPISDAVLHALAVRPPRTRYSERLLPHLKIIELTGNTGISPQGVVKLFASRNSNPKSHIKGNIKFLKKPTAKDADALSHYSSSLTYSHGKR
ncbi:hypothetical protein BOTBODRAFT_37798 [Botryobasidium botryosum FD-172 SS1]|uniref:F-box domain-containing protein n=1 Tax=Botryobasidium botryosum (strain FD-172 SS1) TaxID=930990 RepID=A0A067M1R0_BOTB1|nr:hypothetical protein BOTBODRAFT_37798 [Botryobasidium botryosum FD-172 SS1]